MELQTTVFNILPVELFELFIDMNIKSLINARLICKLFYYQFSLTLMKQRFPNRLLNCVYSYSFFPKKILCASKEQEQQQYKSGYKHVSLYGTAVYRNNVIGSYWNIYVKVSLNCLKDLFPLQYNNDNPFHHLSTNVRVNQFLENMKLIYGLDSKYCKKICHNTNIFQGWQIDNNIIAVSPSYFPSDVSNFENWLKIEESNISDWRKDSENLYNNLPKCLGKIDKFWKLTQSLWKY